MISMLISILCLDLIIYLITEFDGLDNLVVFFYNYFGQTLADLFDINYNFFTWFFIS